MASDNVRETRLHRLRARYRRRTTITAIVSLLIGLVLGFAVCVVSLNQEGFVSRLFRLGPTIPTEIKAIGEDIGATPTPESTPTALPATLPIVEEPKAEETTQPPVVTATPEVTEPAATAETQSMITPLTAEPTAKVTATPTIEVTATPTAEPTIEVTATPTAVPTIEVTATPTAVPTIEVTATPTAEPTIEVTATPTAEPTAEVMATPTAEPTAEVTSAPTAEPPAEVTAALGVEPLDVITLMPTDEPTPGPTLMPIVVPFGQAYSLETEITADGKPREVADASPYTVLNMTLKVNGHRGPAYYQEHYSTMYKLKGDEAVVELELTVNDYVGTATLVPQDFMNFTLIGSSLEVVNEGYQLMNAEIGGQPNVAVTPGVATQLYKRYAYSAAQGDMLYLSVTTWRDGNPQEVWFDLVEPAPAPTEVPESLSKGSSGEEVTRLQTALIAQGALSGEADGKFGNQTAEAVREMQKRYGMEETGIADAAFQARLYAEDAENAAQ